MVLLFDTVPFKTNLLFFSLWKTVLRMFGTTALYFLSSYRQRLFAKTKQIPSNPHHAFSKLILTIQYPLFGAFEISMIFFAIHLVVLIALAVKAYVPVVRGTWNSTAEAEEGSSSEEEPRERRHRHSQNEYPKSPKVIFRSPRDQVPIQSTGNPNLPPGPHSPTTSPHLPGKARDPFINEEDGGYTMENLINSPDREEDEQEENQLKKKGNLFFFLMNIFFSS